MHLGIEFHIGQNFWLNLWPGLLEFDLFSSIKNSPQGKFFLFLSISNVYLCSFYTNFCRYQNFWWGSEFRILDKKWHNSYQLLHHDEHLSRPFDLSSLPSCEDCLILVGSKELGWEIVWLRARGRNLTLEHTCGSCLVFGKVFVTLEDETF
jgi:hypothetical protein